MKADRYDEWTWRQEQEALDEAKRWQDYWDSLTDEEKAEERRMMDHHASPSRTTDR